MLLDPERDAADIDWLKAYGATLLNTAGACACTLPTFTRCFVEASGREPGPRVQLMLRQLAELNKTRMQEKQSCIGTAEILVAIAHIMGVVITEPLTCETE